MPNVGGEEDQDEPGNPILDDLIRKVDAVLPLLTFLAEREDSQSMVTILVVVLVLRAAAGCLGGEVS